MKKLLLFICLICSISSFAKQYKEMSIQADSLLDVSIRAYNLGDYDDAIRIGNKALKIYDEAFGTKHLAYAVTLIILAESHYALGNYPDAVLKGKKALRIIEKKIGVENTLYAKTIVRLSCYQSDSGNYSEALRLGEQALKICGKVFGTEHPDYALSLSNLANYQSDLCNYSEALRLGEQALEIRGRVLGTEHPDYASSLSNLATYQSYLGNYSEAVRLCEQSLEIYGKVFGTEHPDYATILNNFAVYQSDLGNYSEAVRLCEQSLEIRGRVLGTEHPNYASSLSNLANYQSDLGNYSEALRLGEQALEIRGRVLGTEHPNYASSLSNLANYQSDLGNNSEALRLGEQALEIRGRVLGTEHPDYASSLSNLANYQADLGNYSEALRLGEQALEIRGRVFGTEHPDYALSLRNLAGYQEVLGNYTDAVRIEKQALEIISKLMGCNHPDYAHALNALGKFYYSMGNIMEAAHYAYYSTDVLSNFIMKQFSNLTVNERINLRNIYSHWYSGEINEIVYKIPTDTLCMAAYNGALFSKGLLLNSEIELRKLLQESGDAVVDSLYEEMRINKLMLQRLYEKPKNERFLNTDSIEKIVDGLEKQLLKRSKVYGDYTKNLRIDYKDVRGKLKDGDLAVEFCSFPLSKDSTMYMALVLRNDMEYPKMIPLFEEKQISKTSSLLEEMQIGTLRRDTYMGGHTATLVWKPLEQYLNNAKNVYFSPSGELYNIAIENIPHWSEDCLMSDKWNIYRLSSTRELAVIRDKDAVRKATVYGGIVYDTGTDVLTADTVRYGRQRSVFYGLYNLSDSLSVRGGVEYLPATKDEAEYVDDALKGRHIASTLRTDMQATEGAFKDMTGKRNNLLHIATHAFYWPEKEVVTTDKDFLFMPNMPQRYKEDKAMTRSGLVLAGANNALRGMKLPEDVNDGILTAKEIAQLDLRGLDLVVLSACQTGLGEVTGDGVFGLQRGFKKAGANSLMMSLWNVDDEATSLFMKEFYRQLMAGNGKHDSMKAAQRHVREYKETDEDGEVTHPYDNYKYWAAFVLLDAIR